MTEPASKRDSLIHNPLCKTLLMLFIIAWAILISKVYDKRHKQHKTI